MRNLKRALSLALASVMLMGMMVVGAGAKGIGDYSDKAEIVNQDAVAVTTELGIFEGYEDGSFGPEKVVTRAEMAVIICKMLYGSDVNAAQFVQTSVFTDVPAWAAGYVNLCASLNIVAGVGDNKYDPNSTVTTAQAALMLSKALGYFKNEADYGSNWMLASTSKATQLGLYGSMDLAADQGLTRQNVAEMTFNALTEAVPVDYSEMFNVYYNVNSGLIYGLEFNYLETLGYTNFDLVYKRGGVQDDQGRPAIVWGTGTVKTNTTNNPAIDEKGALISSQVTLLSRNEIITTSMDPDYIYTKATKAKAIYADLGKDVCDLGEDWTVYYNGQELDTTTDGSNLTFSNATKKEKDKTFVMPTSGDAGDYNWIVNGEVAEFFLEYDNDGEPIVTVVIYGNYMGEVTRVRTDDDGRHVVISDKVLEPRGYELNVKNYYTEEYDVDDLLVYTIGYDEDKDEFSIFSVAVPETVEGSLTAVVLSDWYVRVDGTKIDLSRHYNEEPHFTKAELGEATLRNDHRAYLDPNGFILSVEPLEDAGAKYLYVEAMSKVRTAVEADVVFSDGTKETIKVSELYIPGNGQNSYKSNIDIIDPDSTGYVTGSLNPYEDCVYGYTLNKGKYVLYQLAGEAYVSIETKKSTMVYGAAGTDGTVRLSNTTLFVDIKNGKVYEGHKNVPDYKNVDGNGDLLTNMTAGYGWSKTNDSNWADVVFITKGDPSNEKKTYVWFEKAGTGDIERTDYDETTYYVAKNAYVDGVKVEENFVTDASKGLYLTSGARNQVLNQPGLYRVETTDGNGIVKSLTFLTANGTGQDIITPSGAPNIPYQSEISTLEIIKGNSSNGTIWIDQANNDYYTYDGETVFVKIGEKGVASVGSYTDLATEDNGDYADEEFWTLWVIKVDKDDETYIELAYLLYNSNKAPVIEKSDAKVQKSDAVNDYADPEFYMADGTALTAAEMRIALIAQMTKDGCTDISYTAGIGGADYAITFTKGGATTTVQSTFTQVYKLTIGNATPVYVDDVEAALDGVWYKKTDGTYAQVNTVNPVKDLTIADDGFYAVTVNATAGTVAGVAMTGASTTATYVKNDATVPVVVAFTAGTATGAATVTLNGTGVTTNTLVFANTDTVAATATVNVVLDGTVTSGAITINVGIA